METIYLLSGLGADKRVFHNLEITGFKMVFIDWIPPLKKESMASYAFRLSGQFKNKKPIILGLSFGGMIALELAKILDAKLVFLISSAKHKEELNPWFAWPMKSNLIKLLPRTIFKKSNFALHYLFGVTDAQEKKLLTGIIADTDLEFLYWSLNAMYRWKNEYRPEHLIEIHGTADRLIPFRENIPFSNTIKGGGHLMILNKAPMISKIILDYLHSYNS